MKRFFTNQIDEKEGVAVIKGAELHHLSSVLRFKEGDKLTVFDGKGAEYIAYIEVLEKRMALLRLLKKIEVKREPALKIVLAQGIPKAEKMDFIIQKAAEIGISGIIPIITSRSIPDLRGDKAVKKVERWQKIATEASKQCRRTCIPEVRSVTPFSDFLNHPFKGLKLILWEGESERKIRDLKELISKDILIAIGPEGGFSEEEVEKTKKVNFISISLGERVLRVETASISALSILLFMGGDLG